MVFITFEQKRIDVVGIDIISDIFSEKNTISFTVQMNFQEKRRKSAATIPEITEIGSTAKRF